MNRPTRRSFVDPAHIDAVLVGDPIRIALFDRVFEATAKSFYG